MFSNAEVAALGIDQLSPAELDAALEAFNGFAALFSKEWVLKVFRGAQSPIFVRAIVGMWKDWLELAKKPNADQILTRWRQGFFEAGIQAEIVVMARLARAGAQVELFVKTGNRVPDCKATIKNESIFLEISQRGISEIRKRANKILHEFANAAAEARPGLHGKVAILTMTGDAELERAKTWLRAGPDDGSHLDNLVAFHTGSFDEPNPTGVLESHVPAPRMFSTTIKHGADGVHQRGTAVLGISDRGAQALLESEASQLPQEEGGVVVLDISAVIGGINEWTPLIRRRFQPQINRRISAVLLLSRALAAEGPVIESALLVNPHARNPLSADCRELLQRMLD